MKCKFYKTFRSFVTAIIAIAFLVPGLSLTTIAQDNLLTNGGFEDDMNGWVKAREQDEASIITDNVFAGTKALMVGPGGWSTVRQTVSTGLVADATYRLSAAVKSATGTAVKKVAIDVGGSDVAKIDFTATEWEAREIEFTLPAGTTEFTVYLNNRAGGEAHFDEVKVEVVVADVTVTGVSLDATAATLEVGETTTLVAAVAPADATDQSVSWTSSDETVATVDANGVVTAVAEGTATITVTTTDGNLTAEAVITVTPAQSQGENLLTNGGFEDDMNGWVKAREQDEASIITDNVFAGAKALMVGPGGWSTVRQSVSTGIVAGATYRLSAALKSATGTAVKKVAIDVGGSDLAKIDFTAAEWEAKEIEFTLPSDATEFTVYLNNRAGGEAHFDEVKVVLVEVVATGVSLDVTAATLEVGETTTLVAAVTPADATDQSVSWTSSDETVATVDANGVVTAVAEGTATITVTTTDGDFTAAATITVVEPVVVPVTGVSLNITKFHLVLADTLEPKAIFAPEEATDTEVTWSSSDDAVATVNAAGQVIAVAAGEVIITATTNDGGFTATTEILVLEENLVVNGSFEDDLTGWTGPEASLRTYDFFPVQGERHFTLRNRDTEGIQQITGLTPGATYVLSGFIRNNPSGVDEEIILGVRFNEADSIFVANQEKEHWPAEPYILEFTLDADQSTAEIFIRNVMGDNWAYADYIVLYQKEEDTTSSEDITMSPLTVYPNPVRDGKLFISNAGFGQYVTVQMISVDGRMVMSKRISAAGQILSVDISNNVKNGLYILRVSDENRNYTSRVIISK